MLVLRKVGFAAHFRKTRNAVVSAFGWNVESRTLHRRLRSMNILGDVFLGPDESSVGCYLGVVNKVPQCSTVGIPASCSGLLGWYNRAILRPRTILV